MGKIIKHKISVTLASDVIQHFKELAEKNDTSLSHEINKVLKHGKDRGH
jgi:hypothetical protein